VLRPLLAVLATLAVVAPAGAAKVVVTSPANNAKVPITFTSGRTMTTQVTLRGRGPANTNLTFRADCQELDCSGITFTGRDGRWSTRVKLQVKRKHQRVVVRVGDAKVLLRLSREVAPTAPPSAQLRPNIGGRHAVIFVGDSLAVGTAAPLRRVLDPAMPLYVDARTGRTLSEGMEVLANANPPKGILAFSLFTNDDPINLDALDFAVRSSVFALGPRGCAVWATIVRPKVGGRTYGQVDARLRALALDPALSGRLLIADWARAVSGHRKAWLAKDKIHATAAGYFARAQLYAEALSSCAA
jgi:hypothetical protein